MMFKKLRLVSLVISVVLCLILIADGLFKVIIMHSNDWGLILVGGFFLLAVGPNVCDHFKKE